VNRVVIHYHEIALKGRNRPVFVRQLLDNVKGALAGIPFQRVRAAPGRLVLHLKPTSDWNEIGRRLGWVFGIANYSLALRSRRSLEAMTATALQAVDGMHCASFAVRTKRADKGFPMPSPEISRVLGRALQDKLRCPVDLSRPDLVINVEVLPREAFISVDRRRGLGGLPVGSSGKAVALLSGGIDSPVAAWRMMGRGCRLDLIHFHGGPYQDRTSREKVAELAQVLTRYQLRSRLHLVAFGELQRQIVAAVRRPFRVVLYRRLMLRIAEAIAAQVEARAIVTGESLGQVASQTLANLTVVEHAATLPLLRPLIGMDKAEIRAQAEAIGTYDISIQPDQDCCQLFVPRQPATQMRIDDALEAEAVLDIPAMVQHGCAQTETREFVFPD
jgi:thiamine biosynthesis protein ThiI